MSKAPDSKFTLMSIEGLAGQVSRSTSVNSGRSSYREWRETRCSSTGNASSINPTEEQRPFTPGSSMTMHNVTHDTFVMNDSPIIKNTPNSQSKSFLKHRNNQDRTSELSYAWDRRSPETITATPAIVPCRLKAKAEENSQDSSSNPVDSVTKPKNDCPQPLQSLLNDLVGSQDPLDPLLINTKAVIHHPVSINSTSTSTSCSRNSSKRSSESDTCHTLPPTTMKRCHSVGSSSVKSSEGKDSDYVPMMNNVNCCAITTMEPEQPLVASDWFFLLPLLLFFLPRMIFLHCSLMTFFFSEK